MKEDLNIDQGDCDYDQKPLWIDMKRNYSTLFEF